MQCQPGPEAPRYGNALEEHEKEEWHATGRVLVKQLEHVDPTLETQVISRTVERRASKASHSPWICRRGRQYSWPGRPHRWRSLCGAGDSGETRPPLRWWTPARCSYKQQFRIVQYIPPWYRTESQVLGREAWRRSSRTRGERAASAAPRWGRPGKQGQVLSTTPKSKV